MSTDIANGDRIRAVLFDIGGVIIESPLDAFRAFEREYGLPEGSISGLISADPHRNAWARHERGEVDAQTFATLFEAEAEAAGYRLDATRLTAGIVGEVRPAMVGAISRIRARGLRIGLLTNNFPGADGLGAMVRPDVAVVAAMADAVIESSREGVRKPEPEFYRIACRRLDIEPGDAVFLDDLGTNLKAARALGMRTIKVVDPANALAELESILGFALTGDAE